MGAGGQRESVDIVRERARTGASVREREARAGRKIILTLILYFTELPL